MCPGRTKSADSVDMSANRFIVFARSTELIPVVIPVFFLNTSHHLQNCHRLPLRRK
jgi:hypothetical protein